MSKWPYRILDSFFDRVFRNNLNANFKDIETDLKDQKSRVDNLIIANPQPSEVQDARGTFPVLRDRLDDVDESLAQKAQQTDLDTANINIAKKADITYVDTKTAALASGSPKGVYATLTDLQTAYPTGNTNIYIVTADGKWYYWNSSTWTAGGTYQSIGIVDGSITGTKLDSGLYSILSTGGSTPDSTVLDYISTGMTTAAVNKTYIIDNPITRQGYISAVKLNSAGGVVTVSILRKTGTNSFTVLSVTDVTTTLGDSSYSVNIPLPETGLYLGVTNNIKYIGSTDSYSRGIWQVDSAVTAGQTISSATRLGSNLTFGIQVTVSEKTDLRKLAETSPVSMDRIAQDVKDYFQVTWTDDIVFQDYSYSTGTQSPSATNKTYVIDKPITQMGKINKLTIDANGTSLSIKVLKKTGDTTLTVLSSVDIVTTLGINDYDVNIDLPETGLYIGFYGSVKYESYSDPVPANAYAFLEYQGNPTTGTIAFSRPVLMLNFGFRAKGYETSQLAGQVHDEITTIKNNVSSVQSDLSALKGSLVPFDLLRYKPDIGNFAKYPNAYFFGRWFDKNYNSVDYIATINQGAEIHAKISNTTTLAVQMKDISTTGNTPYFSVSIDGGTFTRYTVADQVTLATGLSTDEHYVRIIASGIKESDDVWNGGQGMLFKGLVVDAGGVVTPVKPYNRYGLFIGDSITAGINVLGSGGTPSVNCAEKAFSFVTCKQLNTACVQVGFGSTGITAGGSGGVPKCITFLDYVKSGVKETADIPDFVVINMGTNEPTVDSATFIPAYQTLLQRIQIKYPGIPIFCMRPFNGTHGADVQTAITSFKNCFFVDTTGWGVTYSDGIHPNESGALTAANKLSSIIKNTIGSTIFFK
jgi:hypothetical protein